MAKKILVVEDVNFLQKAVKEILFDAGYEVILAENGEEGLEKALAKHPDLILLDILMPKMDGMEMLKELRKDAWGKTAKIVILTNLNSKEKLMEAAAEDVNDYYIKSDWEIEDLVEIVNSKLEE